MIGPHRRSLERLHGLLWDIAAKPGDPVLLLQIQQRLAAHIRKTERHIVRWKATRRETSLALKTGRLEKSDARKLRARVEWIDGKLEGLKHLLFVWRCFGDGVAFIHIDRFSLKQTFFETNSVRIKQKPGWLTGKSGFVVEMKLLRDALRRGIPALLTDLTNTIRHGDLCLLIGPDPILIEAKTSPRLNARGKKQVEALSKLSEFFRMDVAEDMRGYDELRRVAMTEAEVGYSDDLNRCIELAWATGVATMSPERGLHYLVAYGADKEAMTEALAALPMISGEPVYLNEFKANAAWAPYYPFVLSIKSAQHLFDFLEGSLGIVVLFDSGEFELHLNEQGIFRVDEDKSFSDPDDDYIVFENRSTGAKAGISKQLLLRVALDLCSPAWLFRNYQAVLDRLAAATAPDQR